jgi:ABC-type glycerol-3-phosphate transport system permease component
MPHVKLTKSLGFAFASLVALLWLVPVAMMLAVSFMPPNQRAPKFGGLLINGVSLDNYRTVFSDAPILRHLMNSLIIACSSVLLVVLFGSLAGYAFARLRIRWRETWFFLVISALMLPIPTMVVPLFQVNKTLGLLDNYLGLILPYAAFGTPFALIIFRSFFEHLPVEVEEAAKMDGCSKLGIYWRIVMPISWPAIAAVIIFQFMASFNEFVLALVTIDRNELKPMTLVPLMYSGQFMARPGVMFATLALITIPVLIIYILMQRYLTRGMMAGAVKG